MRSRRAVLLLATMLATLIVASGVALAATISCPNRAGNLCVGTDQSDTMNGRDSASDDMRGKAGFDTLNARGANDKLTGGLDNDTLNGGLGSDTYIFDDGWEQDNIVTEGGGVDTLDFSAVSSAGEGMDVHVNLVPTAGSPEASAGTSTLNFPSTVVIENVRTGTSGFVNQVYGNAANNRFVGSTIGDQFVGGSGNDVLLGGGEQDALIGGSGNDTLKGGASDDEYRFLSGVAGKDTITDTTTSDNFPSSGNVVTTTEYTTSLTINLNSSSSGPEVTNKDGSFTVNWSGNVIDIVENASSSNDTVTGNAAANDITSEDGLDHVFGNGGDDIIDVHDGGSPFLNDDSVDCGAGTNDTVYYDPPASGSFNDTVANNCENQFATDR